MGGGSLGATAMLSTARSIIHSGKPAGRLPATLGDAPPAHQHHWVVRGRAAWHAVQQAALQMAGRQKHGSAALHLPSNQPDKSIEGGSTTLCPASCKSAASAPHRTRPCAQPVQPAKQQQQAAALQPPRQPRRHKHTSPPAGAAGVAAGTAGRGRPGSACATRGPAPPAPRTSAAWRTATAARQGRKEALKFTGRLRSTSAAQRR